MNERYIFDLYIKKNFALFTLLNMLEWNVFIVKEMRISVIIDIFMLEWRDFVMKKLQISISSNIVV